MSESQAPHYANGKICYLEIPATDFSASMDFYKEVFNWRFRTRADGSIAFDEAAGEVSGTFVPNRNPTTEAGILVYIMVDNAAETIDKIRARGCKIVQEIGGDYPEITARFLDPGGNLFGIYQEPV